MGEQIRLDEVVVYTILRRIVEISKRDIRKYKRMIAKNSKRHSIKRNAIDACLFLEWVKENFLI